MYSVGEVGLFALLGFGEMEMPEERLDGADGEEADREDEKGEYGDGVLSKSDSGESFEGSEGSMVVSVMMKGLVTSLATLTIKS